MTKFKRTWIYLLNVLHKQKPCAATLQNCKIFYNYVRNTTRKQPSDVLWITVLKIWEQLWKGFLLKSLKNTSEQVHFYQHYRPVNCTLTKKWTSLLEFLKYFTFWSPSNSCFWIQSRSCKRNIVHEIDSSTVHFLVKAIFFRQNSFSFSRGVNRLIISGFFWFFSRIYKNSSQSIT